MLVSYGCYQPQGTTVQEAVYSLTPRLPPRLPEAHGTKMPWAKNSLLSAGVSASKSAPPSYTRT